MSAATTSDAISRRQMIAIAAVVAVLTAAGLAQVWLHMQVIAIGYDISRETRRHHALSEQNQKLRLELATRMDPALIERIARQELKMVPPDPRHIRAIRATPRARAVAEAARP